MPSTLIFDVEFEADVMEVAENLELLRGRPLFLSAYERACRSIRKAKLLLFSIGRDQETRRYVSADRFLKLAEEAVRIAEMSEPRIPAVSRTEFRSVRKSLLRHATELRKHLDRYANRQSKT